MLHVGYVIRFWLRSPHYRCHFNASKPPYLFYDTEFLYSCPPTCMRCSDNTWSNDTHCVIIPTAAVSSSWHICSVWYCAEIESSALNRDSVVHWPTYSHSSLSTRYQWRHSQPGLTGYTIKSEGVSDLGFSVALTLFRSHSDENKVQQAWWLDLWTNSCM